MPPRKKIPTENKKSVWKPGQSGNPKGRPTMIPLEIQEEANRNKVALKKLILMYFNLSVEQVEERQRTAGIPYLERILGQCFERTAIDGNVQAFRMLLEIVFGKLPEEAKEFEVSQEEKDMILIYRSKLKLEEIKNGQTIEDESGNNKPSSENISGQT